MENNSYNSKSRETVVESMENLLHKLQKEHKYLALVNKRIKEIDKDLAALEQYYLGEWLDDYNHFEPGKIYDVLSQDHIYECMQDIYTEKLKLLKYIVKQL